MQTNSSSIHSGDGDNERLPLLGNTTSSSASTKKNTTGRHSITVSELPSATKLRQDEHYHTSSSGAQKQQRSQSLIPTSYCNYGSTTMSDLLNIDEITLLPANRRASASGCIVDIGGLLSLLPDEEEVEEEKEGGEGEEPEEKLFDEEQDEEHLSTRSAGESATYWKLLRYNTNYTLYILSYFSAHAGEWFTYVAQISAVEQILEDSNNGGTSSSQTAVSILIAIRMVPNVMFASFGGAIADCMDRRVSMIYLDIIGIFVVLLYLPVLHYKSLGLLYTLAFTQATVAALYDPIRQSIVPLLVPKENYLKKATTIASLAWSLMAALGSSLGGIIASSYGIRTCFILDSLTYVLSAFLMWCVPGTWKVETTQERRASLSVTNVLRTYKSMTAEGIDYLSNSSFGLFVTLKASGALSFGSTDVLNVKLSHIDGDEVGDARRLGILFGVMGVGCLLGPLAAERYISMKYPHTMLASCIVGYLFLTFGFAGIGISNTFVSVCISTGLRGIGSSIMWTNSTLLLQKFSSREMLGRVLSVDYGLCTLTIATSAFVAGILEDHANMSPEQTSWIMALVAFVTFCGWGMYYVLGFGPIGASKGADCNVVPC